MKSGIIFGIGLLVGGGIGTGVTYMVLKSRVDARVEEEVNRFKQDQKKRRKRAESASEGHSEGSEDGKEEKKPEKPSGKRTKTSLDDGPVHVERTDYHKISENYMKKVPEIDSDGVDKAEKEHPEDDSPDFEFISTDEVNKADPEEITYLIWDPDEDVLVDEYGDKIEQRELLVGDLLSSVLEEQKQVGIGSQTSSTYYIRNNKIGQIYEVETTVDGLDAGLVND